MRLTNYTDYALRVLIYLAAKGQGERATITEITDIYGISRNHLTKVIHQLGQIGVIETIRGRGGGIVLHKDPQEITIGAIVRETEEDFHLVECFNRETNQCILTPVCGLKGVLHEALTAYLKVLDRYTIADIMDQPSIYREIFQMET